MFSIYQTNVVRIQTPQVMGEVWFLGDTQKICAVAIRVSGNRWSARIGAALNPTSEHMDFSDVVNISLSGPKLPPEAAHALFPMFDINLYQT